MFVTAPDLSPSDRTRRQTVHGRMSMDYKDFRALLPYLTLPITICLSLYQFHSLDSISHHA